MLDTRNVSKVCFVAIAVASSAGARIVHAQNGRQAQRGNEETASLLESYQRATSIVDAAIAAHGGLETIRAARQLRLIVDGWEYHRHQSRGVAQPYDSTVYRGDMLIDLDHRRTVYTNTRGYPGGFYYTNRSISTAERQLTIDLRNGTYNSRASTAPPTVASGDHFLVPQMRLLAMIEGAPVSQRRHLGRVRTTWGQLVDAVTFQHPNGFLQTYGFDPESHRLVALLSIGADNLQGDETVETEFGGYRMLNGMLLPTTWRTYRGPVRVNEYRYISATPGYTIPDSLLSPPAGFTEAAPLPAAEPVRELARGVWSVRAPNGSNTIVVAFADHLLVMDTQTGNARHVLGQLPTLAPGKPLRYVVPTHHHSDHFGGVRHYAAAGATTVTTPGNVELFRQYVTAPYTSLASHESQGTPTPNARVEAITGKRRVFSDGTRTVEIHDVGPNAHAEEMLVLWIPEEGIFFQADLIEAPPSGGAQRGANAEATMQLARFIREKGWNVRVFGGAHAFLASPEEFAKLIAFPIITP